MKRNELVEELDRTLNVAAFPGDASNNGLQIEGAPEVKRILFGVDGCLALFEHAAAGHFDFVFVHHGISWGGEPRRFTGIHAERFDRCIEICNRHDAVYRRLYHLYRFRSG